MVPDGYPVRLIVVDPSNEVASAPGSDLVLISSELPWNDESMWALLRELAEDRDDLEAWVMDGNNPDLNAPRLAVAWPNREWMSLVTIDYRKLLRSS